MAAKNQFKWVAGSVALHLVVFALLIGYTAQHIKTAREDSSAKATILTKKKIQKLTQKALVSKEDEFREDLEELLEARRAMSEQRESLVGDLAEMEQDEAPAALQRAKEALELARTQQGNVLESQAKVAEAQAAEMKALHAMMAAHNKKEREARRNEYKKAKQAKDVAMKAAEAGQRQASISQKKAVDDQIKAVQRLGFADEEVRKELEQFAKASLEAQKLAEQAQGNARQQARGSQNQVERPLDSLLSQKEKLEAAVEKYEKELAVRKKELATKQEALKKRDAEFAQMQQVYEKSKKSWSEMRMDDGVDAYNRQLSQTDRDRSTADNARRNQQAAQVQESNSKKSVDESAGRLAQAQAKLNAHKAAVAVKAEQIEQYLNAVHQSQAHARALQQSAERESFNAQQQIASALDGKVPDFSVAAELRQAAMDRAGSAVDEVTAARERGAQLQRTADAELTNEKVLLEQLAATQSSIEFEQLKTTVEIQLSRSRAALEVLKVQNEVVSNLEERAFESHRAVLQKLGHLDPKISKELKDAQAQQWKLSRDARNAHNQAVRNASGQKRTFDQVSNEKRNVFRSEQEALRKQDELARLQGDVDTLKERLALMETRDAEVRQGDAAEKQKSGSRNEMERARGDLKRSKEQFARAENAYRGIQKKLGGQQKTVVTRWAAAKQTQQKEHATRIRTQDRVVEVQATGAEVLAQWEEQVNAAAESRFQTPTYSFASHRDSAEVEAYDFDALDLNQMSLAELYRLAVRAEREMTTDYRAYRAAQLAQQETIPFSKAMELIHVQQSLRPDLQSQLDGRGVKNSSDVQKLGHVLGHAHAEMSSMVQSARSLGQQMNDPDGMEQTVAKGAAGWFDVKYGEEQSRAGNFSRTKEDGQPVPPKYSNQHLEQQSYPGRKIFSGQQRRGWMYIDSWHTLGPFDNRNRQARHKQFGPENQIDLDAVYSGKGEVPLRWEFVQNSQLMAVPENPTHESVYYAYSEVWCEEACTLNVAMGADDAALVWINDQLVFESSDRFKAWLAAEGIVSVSFKKGNNTLLFRIENGPAHIAYSVAMEMK